MLSSVVRKIFVFYLATALTLVFGSCRTHVSSQQNQNQGNAVNLVSADSQTVSQPQLEVLIDDAMLKKPYAIIGGTIHNISLETLSNVKIVIELKHRQDERIAINEIQVKPANLAPGAQGSYSLSILSDEWKGSRLQKIYGGDPPTEITFTAKPGLQRPPERPNPIVRLVKSPQAKTGNRREEFINTPDTPIRVP